MPRPNFYVIKGQVNRIGAFEKTKGFETTFVSGTLGQVNNKALGAVSLGKAKTVEEVTSQSISLLKIGNETFTDISVSSRAFFDALAVGDKVGCVLSDDQSSLIYVKNHTQDIEIEGSPFVISAFLLEVTVFVMIAVALLVAMAGFATQSFGMVLYLGISVALLSLSQRLKCRIPDIKKEFQQAVADAES